MLSENVYINSPLLQSRKMHSFLLLTQEGKPFSEMASLLSHAPFEKQSALSSALFLHGQIYADLTIKESDLLIKETK